MIRYRDKWQRFIDESNDSDNEWGFRPPDSPFGPRLYNDDLKRIQGTEYPDYGEVVEQRTKHIKGQEIVYILFDSGWQQEWYNGYVAQYRYREGWHIGGRWYPRDWEIEEGPLF